MRVSFVGEFYDDFDEKRAEEMLIIKDNIIIKTRSIYQFKINPHPSESSFFKFS